RVEGLQPARRIDADGNPLIGHAKTLAKRTTVVIVVRTPHHVILTVADPVAAIELFGLLGLRKGPFTRKAHRCRTMPT
ncbi:MAG TPA: hypothetical protein VMK16_07655, partial [Acidimicrobiales bacterium]|nr:hypothetical protein [Acidimicrobiales bacterium]